MRSARLGDMIRGWFVGNFTPTALSTNHCEVAVRTYRAGEREATHYHCMATEVTLVLSGRIRMAGREWTDGDIVVLEPGEPTDFEALTDTINIVVKVPGIRDDKYLV